jgi:hypothetical protein
MRYKSETTPWPFGGHGKAFDKVWQDGLRLKMLKAGVGGKMFHWISHLLANRTARILLQGHACRKVQIQNGVPQGGVLSPALILIYINDVTEKIPNCVQSSLYADDLALWLSARYDSIASFSMQMALWSLESWSSKWLLKINEGKTTYIVFTLSTKRQVAKLVPNGKAMREDETPSYLGITLGA